MVGGDGPLACTVSGVFHRAVDPAHRAAALAASRAAGRYSPADVPTLYLSASPAGVAAAMIAHTGARSPTPDVLTVEVVADRIVDLRAHEALRTLGIDPRTPPPTGRRSSPQAARPRPGGSARRSSGGVRTA
ncbi:MAG: hypothetical protein JWR33_2532 [Naasia sp.]|jgi:RES domain-containing protein|nr:hypothetical protein [Naasia sp.]